MSDEDVAVNRSEPIVPDLDASRFDLLEAIGSGGMGTVYRALQRSVGRYVAVKMLAPEHAANAMGLARFVREANAIARLAHPNIVQLIDFGRDGDGRLLLVMELLEGESLRALIRREKTLDVERAAWVTVQCLNALRAAHAAGVIHRDLKPENIFIHHSGGEDHVKVLDFGVAKLTQSDVGEHTTQGSLVGTLRYMAPEQIAGDPPDPRIDVYAMGVLLYEMLSGAVPYNTRDRFVLLRQIIAEPPHPLHLQAPHVPPPLCDVVMHALVKDPGERFASAEEFRRALLPFLPSEAARSQVLSDAGVRAPTAPSSLPESPVHSGAFRIPPAAAPAPSAWPATAATEYLPASVQPPRRSRWLIPLALAGVCLLAVTGGAAGYVYSQLTTPPMAPKRATPPVAQPVPVALPAPVAVVVPPRPAPIPVVMPAPSPVAVPVPTRMVMVTTTPSGARVADSDGTSLCPSTPCAIPVTPGRPRSIQVVRGSTTVSAVLDGSQGTVALDLAALAPPSTPHTHGPRTHRDNDNGLPMFLPGGGH